MTPEEWPIAAEAADESKSARPAERRRLDIVRQDFFLDPSQRLTEQERALMTVMLHDLVGTVADAIRAELPGQSQASNDAGNALLIDSLTRAGLLDEPGLMGILLRRADEERIATSARARSGRREARALQSLVSHDDGHVAAAAMALVLARGRRRDRFGQTLVAFDDVPDSSAPALAYSIAAAIRAASAGLAADELDYARAAERVIDARDPARGTDALTRALIHFLEQSGTLTDDLLLAAAHEGEVGFLATMLSSRSGLPTTLAIDELLSGNADHVMALFRAAGASRQLCASLLAGIGDLLNIDDAGAAIQVFEAMTDAEARQHCSWLAASPLYRAALGLLEEGRG